MPRVRDRLWVAAFALLLLAPGQPATADDAIVVGATAAITGPLGSAYGPVADGMRLYIDRLNQAGGIDGKKIQLIVHDDQSDGSKGAANVKRLLDEENVALLINDSASTTYQPTMAAVRRANVPVLFTAVCPKEVYPPAQPLMFCTNAFASRYDSRAALDFIQQQAGTQAVDVGIFSQTLPIARIEADYAEALAKTLHMNPVVKEVLPVTTSDFSSFATSMAAAKPAWIWAWIAWELQTGSLDSLRRLGWSGDYLGWAHAPAEDELPGVKDPTFFVIGSNAFFVSDLPVQRDILAAAKQAGVSYPASRLTDGWIAGMTIEAALRAASAHGAVTPAAINAAMETLTVDTKGLRGNPIVWTKENHFRTEQAYRVYHWQDGAIKAVGDWRRYEVK
jgi:branched-chain amino acid transport system substrate-binding protein